VDVPALLTEVARALEAATAAEATCAVIMLTTESSTQETVAAWDSATLRVGDA
jgi:hypothetical protein